jgi:hypothetical protein
MSSATFSTGPTTSVPSNMTNYAAVRRANTASRNWSSRTSTVIQRRYARRIRGGETLLLTSLDPVGAVRVALERESGLVAERRPSQG